MTIHYEVSGKGYPVVFLHGYGQTHRIWDNYRAKLSGRYKVITPDLPGFGQSDSLPYELSLDMVANSIYDCLKKLNISECIIMGHSLGGYVTLEIAKRFPNIVSHIGLIHSSALADTKEKKESRVKAIEFIQRNGVTKFIESFVPTLFHENNRAQLKDTIQSLINDGSKLEEKTLTDYMLAMHDRSDSLNFIKEFEGSILFVYGEEDSSIPVAISKSQIKFMKHPYLKNLPKTGHMGMFEEEDEVYKAISKFIEVTHK
jgi:pimeloyl-ACP methyl ester carboxylesterase